MSWGYRVRVREMATAEAALRRRLRLGDILDEAQMEEVLHEALEELGWELGDDGLARRKVEGVTVELDPATREARVRLSREVEAEVAAGVWGDDDEEEAREKARERAREAARVKADAEGRKLDRELEQRDHAIRAALREVVAEVDRRAILRKARELGEVIGVSEETDPHGVRRLVVDLRLPS